MVGFHRYALLYTHRCSSYKLELFTESKTKNESTFMFGDVKPRLGSEVITCDVDIYGSTILEFRSRHTSFDGIAGLQVVLGEPNLCKHGGWHARYHGTGVDLACNLKGSAAIAFWLEHLWSEHLT